MSPQAEQFINVLINQPTALSNAVNSVATSSQIGLVQPDGTIITVSGAGIITVPIATTSVLGVVKPDGTTITVTGGGVISSSIPTGTLLSVVVYSGSQTVTIPAGSHNCVIQMWGATGGAGGVSAGGGNTGGTGGGGYLEKTLTSITPANTFVYTQGAAGSGGTTAPTNGGNGGTTTLASGTQTIGTLTCNGSNGSNGATAGVFTQGTVGGTATGGDINVQGQTGTFASSVVNGPYAGGNNFFSKGADGANTANTPGAAGNPGGLRIFWFT